MNLKIQILFSLASVLFLAACPGPLTPSTPGVPALPHHDVKAEEAQLKASGIKTANFRLRNDLSFADAEILRSTKFKGTSLEYESVVYSLSYANQEKLKQEVALKRARSCELWVEASPDLQADTIRFSASDKFLNGMWNQTSNDLIGLSFSLQLQGKDFQSLILMCWNVLDLEQLRAQVGNLFEITPVAEK